MTGTAPGRPGPASLLRRGGQPPLPARPVLTTRPLRAPDVARGERRRLAAQPWLGLGGVLLAAVVFFALAPGRRPRAFEH